MILLVVDPIPSDLLVEGDEGKSPVTELVAQARSLLKNGHFREAEAVAEVAMATAHQQRQIHPSGLGWAALCRSDIYRETGRLDPALPMAIQACDVFRRQPAPFQRHNEGAALYNLGLLYHIQKDLAAALQWYDAASQMFRQAQEYWRIHRQEHRMSQCARMVERIAAISQSITELAFLQLPVTSLSVCAANRPFRNVEPDGYHLNPRIEIGGKPFQVLPLSDVRYAVLERQSPVCIALPIPDPVCPQWGARRGDYILAQQRIAPDPDAPFWIAVGQDQLYFGRFERRPPDAPPVFQSLHPARVIGGTGEFSGHFRPVAFLRPIRDGS